MVVHGQMKSEKERRGAFAQGKTQILVATTVKLVDIP